MSRMKHSERAIVFKCGDKRLLGIVHGAGCATTGVLVIVGGPQYRTGSHRQFLLLARYLAANNVPVLRFDYRGMGDSEGEIRTFEEVEDDIRAAIDAFFIASPSLQSVVLWGLCDAASAALFYGYTDPRVHGLMLLNPWVRTESGEAKAYLKHYYLQRLFEKVFWKKVLSGQFELIRSLTSLWGSVKASCSNRRVEKEMVPSEQPVTMALPKRMYQGLESFQGRAGIIISGNDLTAAEFEDMVKASKAWKNLLKSKAVEIKYIPQADHTFSRQVWRDQVAEYSLQWISQLT